MKGMTRLTWPLKGVIFDCDGVLIDSREANVAFYNQILEGLNMGRMSREDEAYVHSQTIHNSIARIVPDGRLEEAWDVVSRFSFSSVVHLVRLHSGLVRLLKWLQQSGILCAVNTNRTNTMDLVLNHFELETYFSPVVTSSDVRRPKPHPESVQFILKSWDLQEKDVVFIGDSEVDQLAAQASGVAFWAFKNPDLAADLHIADFDTLLLQLTHQSNRTSS
jgi:phosphoglycolate phosphatase-like HAD superfamily hydrolase